MFDMCVALPRLYKTPMGSSDPTPFDPPAVWCRHLLLCRTLWYDPSHAGDSYSLGRIVVNLSPPAGLGFPFVVPYLFAYVQLFGTVGEYDARLKLLRVTEDDAGGDEVIDVVDWGPWLTPVTGLDIVECHGYRIDKVPFGSPGLYEFQFWLDGFDEPLASERFQVLSSVEEMP